MNNEQIFKSWANTGGGGGMAEEGRDRSLLWTEVSDFHTHHIQQSTFI